MADHKYGVVYTPSTVAAKTLTPSNDALLDEFGINFIRITWVDWINNVRYRVVPRPYFSKLLHSARPGISLTKACFGLVFLALAPGFSGIGEYQYVLDLSTFRLCPYAPGHASILGFFQEKLPTPQFGLAVPFCPRSILKRITDDAKATADVSFLVGFESEFILLSATSPKLVTVNNADWSVSSKLPSGSVESTVLQEIAECLEAAGIELQMYHAEAAPGQAIVTGPLTPLEAADALVHTRETIYNVASKHGLRATFAPRLYSNSCGSGAHAHISVHKRGDLKTGADAHLAPTLSRSERSFLQGVLAHVPALCALTLPTTFSYARVLDGIWSGGTYAAWGSENREAAVRLCGTEGQHHFEVRFIDGTANPHLVLAGLVGAGAHAVKERALLTSGDCAAKPVAQMAEEEREALGVQAVGRLPASIEQARKNLGADKELTAVLGEEFVARYLGTNAVSLSSALISFCQLTRGHKTQTLETLLKAETEDETVTKLVQFY
ncbi:hypothetical protein PHLCEN_2v7885 [Hermanssonia centrifuga]|uniref:Glutamine synthetase n=1 Tax=Hermanssonia centrifuga TaxID=98765 RepID=A0A2R6NVG2_9APHY|nr:hypothetical protein PHLCEN_2v7885 [Hermanssonia centrifuga]